MIQKVELLNIEKSDSKSPRKSQIRSGSIVFNVPQNIFDRYEKKDLLGQGAYGQVFRVEHKGSKFMRALKVIDKKRTKVPISGLVQEVDNIRKLNHPNILRVYEITEDEQNIYVVSELSNGEELFNLIHRRLQKKQIFSEQEVAQLIKQLLSAICYAHEFGIIHRDIKPENILIEEEQNGKILHLLLIDWGLSSDISKLKMIRQRIGTIDYAAPEVLKGMQYDGRADIWSVGVIMYILLSGESPFPGRNTSEIESLIVRSQFHFKQKIWNNISKDGINLLKLILQPDMQQRLTAKQAIEHQWFNIMKQQQQNVISETVIMRLQKFCCKNLLIQATSHFMVSECVDMEQQQELRQVFKQLDLNGDGKLSLQELVDGLKFYLNEGQVIEVFNRIDTNQSGFIDYSEFLLASSNLKKANQIEQIKEAFELYDKDGNGFVELSELKDIIKPIEGDFDDEVWENLLEELDENHDGKISFDEYRRSIQQFLQQRGNSLLSSLENDNHEPNLIKFVKIDNLSQSRIVQTQQDRQQKSNCSSYNLRSRIKK